MTKEEDERLYDGDNRREWPRYKADRVIPVMFQNPRHPGIGAGLISDLSSGGLRIVAPPTVITQLRWGEVVSVTLSYSEGTREARVEGLELSAVVVEIISNASAFTLRCRFLKPLSPGWVKILESLMLEEA